MKISGQKVLSSQFSHRVETAEETYLDVEATDDSLRVHFRPPLHVDAMWPMSDSAISTVVVDTKTGKVSHVGNHNTQALAFGSKGMVQEGVKDLVDGMLEGTRIGEGNYNALKDKDPVATLVGLRDKLSGTRNGEGSPVSPEDISQVHPYARFITKADLAAGTEAGSVKVAGGSSVYAGATLEGNGKQLLEGGAPTVQSINVGGDGISLHNESGPIAELRSVTAEDGAVRVNQFKALGRLEEAENGESGLRALAHLLRAASGGQVGGNPSLQPHTVHNGAKNTMGEALTGAIAGTSEEQANVPGVDLRKVLGKKE